MSDADELEEIRRRKRERLKARADEGDTTAAGGGDTPSAGEPATPPDEPIHVGGAGEFADLLDRYDPVLVDFYADWCGPCRMLEPVVADLAAETAAAVAKVDADVHDDLTARYGVRGLPTLLLFSGGEVVERVVGVEEQAELAALVGQYA